MAERWIVHGYCSPRPHLIWQTPDSKATQDETSRRDWLGKACCISVLKEDLSSDKRNDSNSTNCDWHRHMTQAHQTQTRTARAHAHTHTHTHTHTYTHAGLHGPGITSDMAAIWNILHFGCVPWSCSSCPFLKIPQERSMAIPTQMSTHINVPMASSTWMSAMASCSSKLVCCSSSFSNVHTNCKAMLNMNMPLFPQELRTPRNICVEPTCPCDPNPETSPAQSTCQVFFPLWIPKTLHCVYQRFATNNGITLQKHA